MFKTKKKHCLKQMKRFFLCNPGYDTSVVNEPHARARIKSPSRWAGVNVTRDGVAVGSQPAGLGTKLGVTVLGAHAATACRSLGNCVSRYRRDGWKKNVTSDNFMRYLTSGGRGPMRGLRRPVARGRAMRVRRGNFHIISPSATRGPAGRGWRVVVSVERSA